MTVLLLTIAVLTAISLAGGFYFRRASSYLDAAEGVWHQLRENVERFVRDPTVPDEIAHDVVVFAAVTGCGCFTRALLLDVLRRDLTRKFKRSPRSEAIVKQLTPAQLQALRTILADVIRFDALHLPLLGLLARRLMSAAEQPARHTARSVAVSEVRGQMFTAHSVVERAKRHHRLPKELLAA